VSGQPALTSKGDRRVNGREPVPQPGRRLPVSPHTGKRAFC